VVIVGERESNEKALNRKEREVGREGREGNGLVNY
jgi:hypothetical protein